MTAVLTVIFGAILTVCGTLHACHPSAVTPQPVEKCAPEKPNCQIKEAPNH